MLIGSSTVLYNVGRLNYIEEMSERMLWKRNIMGTTGWFTCIIAVEMEHMHVYVFLLFLVL